jgi:uncharacterized protein YndB with AHSA1/START domain
MKLKTEVIIDADCETVWRLFDNADNRRKWQPALTSYTLRSGTRGEPDAVCELVYDENGRKVSMLETITARREPDFLAGTYQTKWGTAVIVNQFEETQDGKTRWTTHANHTFTGIMKIIALFVARSVRTRTEDDVQRFKLFVESVSSGVSS